MTSIMTPLCIICKHYKSNRTCKAFPDGIPDAIYNSKEDHTKPYPGDNDIQFDPIEGEDWQTLHRILFE